MGAADDPSLALPGDDLPRGFELAANGRFADPDVTAGHHLGVLQVAGADRSARLDPAVLLHHHTGTDGQVLAADDGGVADAAIHGDGPLRGDLEPVQHVPLDMHRGHLGMQTAGLEVDVALHHEDRSDRHHLLTVEQSACGCCDELESFLIEADVLQLGQPQCLARRAGQGFAEDVRSREVL